MLLQNDELIPSLRTQLQSQLSFVTAEIVINKSII